MLQSCPISGVKVDESAVRINSFLVVIGTMVAIFFESGVIAGLFFVDFLVKCANPTLAPLSVFSGFLARSFGVKKKFVDYAPKRFAAFIGALLFGAALFALFSGQSSIFCALLTIVVFCAVLESAFAYCVGCKVYAVFTSLRR